MTDDETSRDLPTLFVLGAPKCGTTSIASWLDQHPQVFMHEPKEPHSFHPDYAYRDKTSLEDLRKALASAPDVRHRGEASTWYLSSDKALDALLDHCPGARLVVCVRNPVDMAVSLHNQFFQHGIETEADFASAWHAWPDRARGSRIPRHHPNPDQLNYRRSCALGEMAEALMHRVPRNQVLFLRLDEISKAPKEAYQRLCDFLDIEPDLEVDLSARNEAIERRSRTLFRATKPLLSWGESALPKRAFALLAWAVWKANTRARRKSPIPPEIRRWLGKVFEDDIRRLQSCSGLDLSDWIHRNA